MPLSFNEARELEQIGVENVRKRLHVAGASNGVFVPGLGDGKMLRADVEDWLKERDRVAKERKVRPITLAAWIAVAVVVVGVVIATVLGIV